MSELRKLEELLSAGFICEAEFIDRKNALLGIEADVIPPFVQDSPEVAQPRRTPSRNTSRANVVSNVTTAPTTENGWDSYIDSSSSPFASFSISYDPYARSSVASTTLISSPSSNAGELFVPNEYLSKPMRNLIEEKVKNWKSSNARNIRLFVSSTFRDMNEERNVLTKYVFPEVRRVCTERNINFVEVDLRWGITKEEASGGQVISLCLNEIDNSRPYMIGMLGERYGWAQGGGDGVPDKLLSQSLSAAIQDHPWLAQYTDRSVTEIEMLYGALFYPQLAPSSAFYFRDSGYADTLSLLQRKPFEAENASSAEKVANLKARIRSSGLPVRENYKNAREFGDMVLKDLLAFIDRDFPLKEKKKKEQSNITKDRKLQRALHLHHCTNLSDVYVGGDHYFSVIDDYVLSTTTTAASGLTMNKNKANQNQSAPLIVTGEFGCGKSALLGSWVTNHMKNHDEGSEFLFVHFVELSENTIFKVIRRLIDELKAYFGLDKKLEAEPDKLVHQFSEWLTEADIKARGSNKKIIILLDGIDQLEKKAQTLYWLPSSFPPSVRIILSLPSLTATPSSQSSSSNRYRSTRGLNQSSLTTPQKYGAMYELLTKREGWDKTVLRVQPLLPDEKSRLIKGYLAKYSKKLGPQETYQLVEHPATASPVFLRSILEQLRVFGNFDELGKEVDAYLSYASPEDLFDKILSKWETDYNSTEDPTLVQDALSLLFIARSGVLETEMVSLLNLRNRVAWYSFLGACKDSLVNKSGVLTIASRYLTEAVSKRYLLREGSSSMAYHTRFVGYYKSSVDCDWKRKLLEYPYHLKHLNASTEMKEFLSSIDVFNALYNDIDKYDLFDYWTIAAGKEKASAAQVYKLSLSQYKTDKKLSGQDFALLEQKVARFVSEMGDPKGAIPLVADSLVVLEKAYGASSKEVADVLHDLALLYEQTAEVEQALQLVDRSHKIRLAVLGTEHEDTASSVWLLAMLYKKKGEYDKAMELYYQALGIVEKVFGYSHPTVGLYMKTIADVYRKQAVYDKALVMYNKALEIYKTTFGDDHPEVADILDCLGRIHKKKGQYELAKPLYVQALDIIERVYGSEHLKIAEICTDLADVYRKLANYDQALSLYMRGLKINEMHLGKEHPDVAEDYNALGLIYKTKGQLTEAEEVIRTAIGIVERTMGKDHVKVAAFVNNLADVLAIKAKYDEAKALYQRAMKINIEKLGAEHPEVSENLNSLGIIAKKRGEYDDALNYYLKAVDIIHKVYGDDHPKMALYVHDLGVIYRKKGNYDESWKSYKFALDLNEKLFGPNHPILGANLNGLGLVMKKRGQLDEAEEYHIKALRLYETTLGYSDEKVALTLNYLAEVYRAQGKYGYDGAEKLYLRALEINRRIFGEEHPEVAENLNGLAQVYKNQFKFPQAEKYYLEALDISERLLGKTHPHVINRYRNLADNYEKWGVCDKAVLIQNKIQELQRGMKV